jgi:nicotinate-nucleotide adenylyltransferase
LSNSKRHRIGLYGGAFDPPHIGHHALAACAAAQLQLDILYVVPTGDAWHKSQGLSAAHHRLAMAGLNFEDISQVVMDDTEIKRSGPSYTIDTLSEVSVRHPEAELFVLLGADQAARFETWKDWVLIAQMACLAVAPRSLSQQEDTQAHEWHNHPQIKYTLLDMALENVSATDIRSDLKNGRHPGQALKPSVFQYIQHHHLYLDRHDRSL